MSDNRTLKQVVTKIKNKIINYIHIADLKQLVNVSKYVGVRINEKDLERLNKKIKE